MGDLGTCYAVQWMVQWSVDSLFVVVVVVVKLDQVMFAASFEIEIEWFKL